ncbi:hypothetical protein BCR39DRAFT_465781 [Naematelia encephala]|uniref:Protein kinase domain-containing protein n=1 Tax=Naematelia encephala TaxID=71784 RepID=A0A1Y2B987_9TREE|nr:hypothetical protein BCR39DRAFT_465781 [Naematelia encephala]
MHPHIDLADSEAGPSSSRSIPPPPNPRRHRSGILMSRVRANSSGAANATKSMATSKSWGDIASLGLGMSSTAPEGEELSGEEERPSREEWKRVVSEGGKRDKPEEEESMWDNSARFYHHLQSRPASRTASRSNSPERSPIQANHAVASSTSSSPIFVRRALTAPHHGSGPPASLSPNHHFLQHHLPPTFPFSGTSPGTGDDGAAMEPGVHPSHMVILTPTTQEWRELRDLTKFEGDDSDSGSETSDSDQNSQRSSFADGVPISLSASSSMLLSSAGMHRPRLQTTMSADYLGKEDSHTPDPGSPTRTPPPEDRATPEAPVFQPVIIAPSPVMGDPDRIPNSPISPTKIPPSPSPLTMRGDDNVRLDDATFVFDEDQAIFNPDEKVENAPVRFNSIGRRESLRIDREAVERPGIPRVKTKRELERERLFKDLDEEIKGTPMDETGGLHWGGGVQEIGKGGGLTRPGSADGALEARESETHEIPRLKSLSLPQAPSAPRLNTASSPTQPFKPSPLHASPMSALNLLPTPDGESPPIETPPPPPLDPEENISLIRSYARSLVPQHHDKEPRVRSRAPSLTASPPKSPRPSRRRDINRVSLVAGRVVQPFAIPPSTALPPPESSDSTRRGSQPSLQAFSPFRSPPLNAIKSASPMLLRFDSTVSLAPSTGAPSECGTPDSETAGGLGGRGIDDYVILKEAGKGAYGLVMRAKVKGPQGEPVGEEVIIKYIIKARILADCWKKHRVLGPIPVEIHVMDQLRHLLYNTPIKPLPWDPSRPRPAPALPIATPGTPTRETASPISAPNTPDSIRSDSSGMFAPTQKYIASEIKHSPERGHPNICKLLDFFEDREFYYLVMPRFGTGLDLFDRVESSPSGLEAFEIRSLVGQLADAVRCLHANGIVHRDIKDENVILDGEGRCQLIDFGSAAHWRPGKRWDTFSGTLHYASPEILRGEMYGGKEQDVWALGVVAYVLLVGETPFSELPDEVLAGLADDSRALEALRARCEGDNSQEGREEDGGGRLCDAMDLVRQCLQMHAGERPTAEAICYHRYLRGNEGWLGKKGWIGRKFPSAS